MSTNKIARYSLTIWSKLAWIVLCSTSWLQTHSPASVCLVLDFRCTPHSASPQCNFSSDVIINMLKIYICRPKMIFCRVYCCMSWKWAVFQKSGQSTENLRQRMENLSCPGSAHTIGIPAEYQTSKMLQGWAFKDWEPVIEIHMWNQFEKDKLSRRAKWHKQ